MTTADAVVFVGGCDRSGTTVTSRLLAERTSLVVLPEAYFHAVAYRRHGPDATAADALRHWRRRSWGLPASDARGERTPLATYLLDRMTDIHEDRRGVRSPLRVVESTPENIEIGSILLDGFPGSFLVHVVRDPRSVASSLRRADFGPTTAQECARYWKQRVASGLALEARHPDRVVRVCYETALTDPAELDALVARLPPDDAFEWDVDRDLLLDPTSRSVQPLAAGPTDPDRIDSWRRELDRRDIAIIEYECRELMLAFGYDLEGGTDARSSIRRHLDTSRSVLGEMTVGSLRRAVRVGRSLWP